MRFFGGRFLIFLKFIWTSQLFSMAKLARISREIIDFQILKQIIKW